MIRIRISTVVIVSVISAISAAARGQAPLVDRVPADAIVYVGWAGADTLGQPYQQSHLRAMLNGSGLPQLLTDVLPQAVAKITEGERGGQAAAARAFADMTAKVAEPMWRRPWALSFSGIDETPRGRAPKVSLICDAGTDAATVRDAVERFLAALGPMGARVGVTEQNGLVTVAPAGASAAPGGLGADPQFTAAMGHVAKTPAATGYVNVRRLVSFVDDQFNHGRDPAGFARIRDALGLDGVGQVVWTGSFDGPNWLGRTFVDAPAPRGGIAALLESAPLTDDALKSIPATAVLAGAGRFDPAALLERVRASGGALSPDFPDQLADAMSTVNGMLGVDVEADVLRPLGDVWTYYVDPSIGGTSVFGGVLVNRLDDPAVFERGMTLFQTGLVDLVRQQIDDPDVTVEFKQTKRGDLTIHYLATPLLSPAWAIRDGHLYVGLYPQIVASAATDVRPGSILDNPKFKAVRDQLGVPAAAAVSYSDLPALAPQTYFGLVAVSRYAGFADLFGMDAPAMLVPPMHEIMAHLEPAGAVSWSDAAGWHARSITPFPGAKLLSGDPSGMEAVGSTALMTSILLPSLSRARETANRVKCASNLRQIGQAVYLHANENRGQCPPDQGSMLAVGLVPEVFVCPSSDDAEALPMAGDDAADWVNESSHYVYMAAGKKITDGNAGDVMAYGRPEDHDYEGVNILFWDGHVAWQMIDQARETILGQFPDAPGFADEE